MMKIWLVILFFGEVAGTVGPLPGNLAICEDFKQEQLIPEREQRIAEGRTVTMDDGKIMSAADITYECREAMTRPEVVEKYKK